ncbi:MAG: ribonuclease D, partial [Methylocapsa sp.]|nr:ribonuclease D [Methylocapsa sp.]
MTLIVTTGDLARACRRFSSHPFITVDTEFLRETTFWPRLCLIQLASAEEAVAVDALAEGLDLAPFFELMADPGPVKVFHAARQDIEIIWNLAKLIPAPLFDTQVAAMVCGFGEQVSYGDLVKTLANVTLDKSSRFTDWSRRPLLPAQAEYAIADVTYLRDIYAFLRAKL